MVLFFFFKQKTAYELRISDWSSDVCSSDLSAVAWKAAIERRDGPSCLVFSRQNLPHQARDEAQLQAIARGGYVLKDSKGAPGVILIATGSEEIGRAACRERVCQYV